MGNTQSSYLGTVGRGGTSNQTNASFQIGRARRSFVHQNAQANMQLLDMQRNRGGTWAYDLSSGERMRLLKQASGAQKSLEALQGWEDTPYGPARTLEDVEYEKGNRLKGRRLYQGDLLGIRPRMSPNYRAGLDRETGADRWSRIRFNES